MDRNLAYYDGTIRGMILRAYKKPITVPLQLVLELNDREHKRVEGFAVANKLTSFKHVILWEFAPQSGQSVLHFDFVMKLAERIAVLPGTCVILSSAISFTGSDNIIDASILSIRENAALTHYCSLLIGCSSGITWLSTSTAAKQLPMVQLLASDVAFINAPSVDFRRYGFDDAGLIEITNITEENVYGCIKTILEHDFEEAKERYNNMLPLQFNTTRIIVYNMLCYLQFGAILLHWKIMTGIYGHNSLFIKQFMLGIVTFPFKLIRNLIRKNIRTK